MDLDPLSGKANLVTQDMGRVLLNLLNNAFYAVQEHAKTAGRGYRPTVSVRTRRSASDTVTIEVGDNGSGIPDVVKDKIFQPFFTTKPTGQGTGLGLSLSYDIVTKGHGGELKLESARPSEQDEAVTVFTILLPT
jgi:signal transduction histidine kinase